MIGLRLKQFIFILLFFFIVHQAESAKPMPKCSANQYYRILPLIANQSAILNLDNLFEGYNMEFSLERQDQWSKYITLSQKMKLLKKEEPDSPMLGLKSYHLERVGNSWGSSFVTTLERGEKTFVGSGFLAFNNSAPVINFQISVQNNTNTTCFDAVSFPKQDLIIVDCAVKLEKPDSYGFSYINEFYYYKISNHTQRYKTIQNEMFIPFSQITKRSLEIYTQKISGNTYLLRSYHYDGVDQKNQNNTYIDVIMMTDPIDPWVVTVIDRTFLKSAALRISDIKVYLSEIYVLDYSKGLHRIRINTEQDLVYNGFFQAKGFNKFAVYSNNLDDRFQLTLANGFEALEIDWSQINDPRLLNKFSLMPNSKLKQLFINQRFVIVMSTSVEGGASFIYTWILSRGDRSYTTAFKVIKHSNANTFVDLNTEQSYLMIIDEDKISNYAIDEAILSMTLKMDEDYLDRVMNFTIVAKSTQPTSQSSQSCSLVFNFTLLEDNNRTMWAVGDAPPSIYTANYPGKVVIPLNDYALGPNISYRITQVKKGDLKKYKIFQQDQLKIYWENQLPLNDITFLRTQTVNRANSDILIIYTQNSEFQTFVSHCSPNHHLTDVSCSKISEIGTKGQINHWSTTQFISRYSLRNHHVVTYTTKMHYNKVVVDDVSTTENIIQLQQGKGYAGNVTNVQTYGRHLFVTKKYYKIINIYDLQLLLEGIDDTICSITHKLMYNLGIKYFSPQSVETTQFYPNVLFIKTTDTIIVLDMNRQCVPKLLSVLRPVDSTFTQFTFSITKSHLIVTALPNHVVQYDLSRIYLKDIRLTKRYPLYGFKLPKNYDTDVSQYGNCMYITTVNDGGDNQIFVYRAGYPAVSVLYDIIDLYTYQNILIDASGVVIDYITVYSGQELRIFRQYEVPVVQIQNPENSYQFYVQYFNVVTSTSLQLISVSILNLPTKINVNEKLNDIMYTKDLLYSGENQISQINDTDWYEGNVLTIKTDCRDCDDLVVVRNHIHYEDSIELINGLIDYDWNNKGGAFQVYDNIIGISHEGTVRDFIHFPQSKNTFCLSIAAPIHSKYSVSACVEGNGINLYLNSMVSHKGFAFEPYSSKAEELLKVQAAHQLIILVDSSINPYFKSRAGGVFIYALNFDLDDNQGFQQIEYINYMDFGASDKPQYVVNADISYHPETDTYRLYITEIKKGIYSLILKFNSQTRALTILQINYINVPSMLNKININPPYDSTYQAVKAVQSSYDSSLYQSKDLVVLTTGVYHTILFQITYANNFVIIKNSITKFFLRYAYYAVQNDIKYVNGLIILNQVLPQDYEDLEKVNSKQVISVYDIRGMPLKRDENIPQLGLIGAQMIMDRQWRAYDFNLTFNRSDPHSEPRVNLVVVHQFSNKIDQLSLHRNLTVFTKEKVDTQIIYLDLINDFDMKKIRILLNGYSPYPEWKLITIILFSIIGFFILLGGSYVGFKRIRQYRAQMQSQEPEQRTSLITEEKTQRDSAKPQSYDRFSDRYSASMYA